MNVATYARKLSRLRRVASHVDAHLGESLSLDALADIAHLSRFHFERVFNEYSGETPVARVRRLRLALARRRIEAGRVGSLLELAFDSGYGSAEAFSRAFRAAHGLAPSAVRPRAAEARPVRIELLTGQRIQYVHFRGRLGEGIPPFDELRAHALLAGIPRERRKGWCVQLAGDMNNPSGEIELQAALLSERLGQQVPGLQQGHLPEGHYAVLRIGGGFAIPGAAELARHIETSTGWRMQSDAPMLRCFHNASYLPADFERQFDLYVPVER
ncbi:AraC family transcriptional regulator [Uliginosibacterium aquaticum]|uniref:AraC family transcriptional regulator n=1 Tax=Uliginosibacterium aquaticum TaxID=2731212 RepID=A0ABX2ICN9_9RHOO|nr:AraC family transcriptional regulator [Uliginosibacterium aquaticum]NSL54301.1 AraC family transcriptional regulator [Uliginosibacterium aquaticum]